MKTLVACLFSIIMLVGYNGATQAEVGLDDKMFEIIRYKGTSELKEYLKADTELDYLMDGVRSPLLLSFELGKYDVYLALLKAGADPNYLLPTSSSIMGYVVLSDHSKYLEAALKYGGDPDFSSDKGRSPLVVDAVIFRKPENLKLLVEAGADINAASGTGNTALLTSVSTYAFEVGYYLLKKGADYTIENKGGYTVSKRIETIYVGDDPSFYPYRAKMIEFLREKGVEISSTPPKFRAFDK